MYNFLDPKLMPKVTCSAPATDNFEVTNLISDKEAIRVRGYLAYTVTRPPVELEFEFLCPVDISFICLYTTVGRQKCTGIEVFAKNSTTPYSSIGKAVYDKPGLTFCNSRRYTKTSPPPYHDPTNDLFFFRSDKHRVFTDVGFLKIVIFRTDKSVPCLGSIKVYGKPSKSCSQTTVDTIHRIMGRASTNNAQIINQINHKSSEFDIPDEFKDDLTCEIMAVPMTLPSGKTVDRDTLEKHIENEKSFGRKACDPFTGLKFTDTRKPVLNVALKSRIDMFLMRNSNNPLTYGLKRALGSDTVTGSKRHKPENIQNFKCCKCGTPELLYVIPCQHYYCRQCLLSLTSWNCGMCQQEFVKSDAVRCHN